MSKNDTETVVEAKPETKKLRRGFAAMSPEKQRMIASMGGRAATDKGTKHKWTSEEAREAGRLGGIRAHEIRRDEGRPAKLPRSHAAATTESEES